MLTIDHKIIENIDIILTEKINFLKKQKIIKNPIRVCITNMDIGYV